MCASETQDTHAKKREFVPPSEEDVRAYCQSRGNTVDPVRFVTYYEAEQWCRNGRPIRDWKAVVRYWETNGISNQAVPAEQQNNSASFDTDEMWEAALKRSYGG